MCYSKRDAGSAPCEVHTTRFKSKTNSTLLMKAGQFSIQLINTFKYSLPDKMYVFYCIYINGLKSQENKTNNKQTKHHPKPTNQFSNILMKYHPFVSSPTSPGFPASKKELFASMIHICCIVTVITNTT